MPKQCTAHPERTHAHVLRWPMQLRLGRALALTVALALVGSQALATTAPHAPHMRQPQAELPLPVGDAHHPATHPLKNPTFAHTYTAGKTGDDEGLGKCGFIAPTECSLRSAITTANNDAHGATPDLIVLTPGPYTVGSALPTVGNAITLSTSTDQSCPGGLQNATPLDGSGMPPGSDLLTLSNNDVVSGLVLLGATNDGIVITGSGNQVTCSISQSSTRHGVHLGPGAQNNQVGVAGNGGTIGNVDFAAFSNSGDGILIDGAGTTGNVVQNAAVGYDPVSAASAPNGDGIVISGGASGNRVGAASQPQTYVNLIRNNTGSGIRLTGSGTTGNSVTGNYIGTDAIGTTAQGNGGGIAITAGANGNQIGGDRVQGFGNLIAASQGGTSGISIFTSDLGQPAPSGTIIQGNIIGLQRDFGGPLPNATAGISLTDGASMTLIGGEEDAFSGSVHLGNVIAGNGVDGIALYAATRTAIYGNFVGTDPTATRGDVGNGRHGIHIDQGSTANQIGGAGPGQTNYVAGNGYSGIVIHGLGSDNNHVQGNVIGVRGDRWGPLSNGTSSGTTAGKRVCTTGDRNPYRASEDCHAVLITADGQTPGPTGNVIGGDRRAGEGNLLAASLGEYFPSGVLLDDSSGNTIQGNSIGAAIVGATIISYPTRVGIYVFNGSSNNQVGGDRTQGRGNLIGSAETGITIWFANVYGVSLPPRGLASGNHIQGNAIGVDFNGNLDPKLAVSTGILLHNDGTHRLNDTVVGVDVSVPQPNPGLGNLVGATGDCIWFESVGFSTGTQINGNALGVTADGSVASAGCLHGIKMYGNASGTTIQDNAIGAANRTGTTYGVLLEGGPLSGTLITGNDIGTNAAGADLHTSIGVMLSDLGGGGVSNTTVSHNVIGRNTVDGIVIGFSSADTTTNQNRISQNRMFGNGGSGINLNYASANPQGVLGGSDNGPNNQAQQPSITAATYNGGTATLTASGSANPNSTIELFLATAPNGTVPQGTFYVGAVAADPGGAWSFSGPLAASDATTYGLKLVATSTLNTPPQRKNSTSQFSAAFVATSIVPSPTTTAVPTPTTTATASPTATQPPPASATATRTPPGTATATTAAASPTPGSAVRRVLFPVMTR